MGRPSEKRCSCGVNLPLMEIVEGRKEDFIRTKEGKLVHAAYLGLGTVLNKYSLNNKLQIIYRKRGRS